MHNTSHALPGESWFHKYSEHCHWNKTQIFCFCSNDCSQEMQKACIPHHNQLLNYAEGLHPRHNQQWNHAEDLHPCHNHPLTLHIDPAASACQDTWWLWSKVHKWNKRILVSDEHEEGWESSICRTSMQIGQGREYKAYNPSLYTPTTI